MATRPRGKKLLKPIQKTTIGLVIGSIAAFGAWQPRKQSEAVARVHEASAVFQDIMNAKDKGIPLDLLERAHCAVIVPGLKHGGFIVGAKYGKGVLMCRKAHGGWRGPATVRIEGGSVGLQIGAGETDLILLVMNERGAEKLLQSEFKVGGSAAVMAGPVGRTVQAETDAYFRAEMLGWSRSRGAFAGIAVEGSTLREDLDDNEAIYGKRLTNRQILEGAPIPAPDANARELAATLTRYSTWEKK